ncbi:MAG: ferrochelatase [Pseudomonadota bacterium]|nr:ferrochelatase [Pseudomonadota bacterium]
MKGILLVNLGSPDDLNLSSIKRYLKEFLSDDFVVDLPKIVQQILVNCIVIPFRSKRTKKAYEAIWTAEGSPLLINTKNIAQKLYEKINSPVEIAMRYQNPSIESALMQLKERGCREVVVVPLYPHYAEATSLSTKIETERVAKNLGLEISLSFSNEFYKENGYIKALSSKIERHLPIDYDYLLFSYHGIPKRQNLKTDPTYEEQVLQTSKLCAQKLNIQVEKWGVSFQSRIGPGWLQPFTDKVLEDLPKKEIKKIAVVCPSFVADNLETLEEINLEAKETFLTSGGVEFTYIPCLNDDNDWINFLTDYIS